MQNAVFSPPELIQELKRDEGVIPYAYNDSLGYLTIGVGRLIDKRKGGGLTSGEIDYLLVNDIEAKEADLDRLLAWWRNLSDVRKRVIVNMAFNLGVGGLLGFKITLAKMQAGDYAGAAAGMRDSNWYKQVGARAERLAKMMEYNKT